MIDLKDFNLSVLPTEYDCYTDDSMCELYYKEEFSTERIGYRMHALLVDLGNTILTKKNCDKLVEKLSLNSPYQVYLLTNETIAMSLEDVEIDDFEMVLPCIQEFLNEHTEYYLWEYLAYAHLPYISMGIAKKLTSGYSDIDDFYDRLTVNHNQIYFIADRLGMGNKNGLMLATEIYKELVLHEKELRECSKYIDFKEAKPAVKVYIASVNYPSIEAFIEEVERKFKIELRCEHARSAEFDYLVTDNKQKDENLITDLVRKNNDIRIISSVDFLNVMRENKYNL